MSPLLSHLVLFTIIALSVGGGALANAVLACKHHWSVPQLPVDGFYDSVCRLCGEERRFPIWVPDHHWKNYLPRRRR